MKFLTKRNKLATTTRLLPFIDMVPKTYYENPNTYHNDKDIQKLTIKKCYSSLSETKSKVAPPHPQLQRADTQQLEKIEKGSNNQNNNDTVHSYARNDASIDKTTIFNEVDADNYMALVASTVCIFVFMLLFIMIILESFR